MASSILSLIKKDDYTTYDGVSLEVPAAVNMITGTYTGEVTWTIEDARN